MISDNKIDMLRECSSPAVHFMAPGIKRNRITLRVTGTAFLHRIML